MVRNERAATEGNIAEEDRNSEERVVECVNDLTMHKFNYCFEGLRADVSRDT